MAGHIYHTSEVVYLILQSEGLRLFWDITMVTRMKKSCKGRGKGEFRNSQKKKESRHERRISSKISRIKEEITISG